MASEYAASMHHGTARIMSQPLQFFVQEPSLSHERSEGAEAAPEDFYSSGSESSIQAEQSEAAQPGMPGKNLCIVKY